MKTLARRRNLPARSIAPLCIGVVSTALILAGCSDDDDDDNPMAPDPGQAAVRALHLSPDAPDVDVYLNGGTPAIEDLAFESGTEFLEVQAGTYTLTVTGAGAGLANPVLTVPNLQLADAQSYTAVAYGPLDDIQALALADDLSSPGAGNIRVRAIHAADGVGQVDIWNVPAMGAPTPLYTNVDFGEVGAYAILPAAAYRLGFDVDNDATPDLLFSLPALPVGAIANVFAVNDGGAVFLLAQLGDGTTVRVDADTPAPVVAELRAIHLSPDAPEVDIYVNGNPTPAVTDLAFGDGTAFLELEAGSYDIAIAPANTSIGSAVLTVEDLELVGSARYTAVAFDFVANIQALAVTDDFDGIPAGSLRVRAIHTAAGVGSVDVWNLPAVGQPLRLYDDFVFGAVGGYFDLPAGAYTVGLDVDEDATPDLVFDLPALPAGTVANVFAVNDGADVYLLAQLADGTTARIDAR